MCITLYFDKIYIFPEKGLFVYILYVSNVLRNDKWVDVLHGRLLILGMIALKGSHNLVAVLQGKSISCNDHDQWCCLICKNVDLQSSYLQRETSISINLPKILPVLCHFSTFNTPLSTYYVIFSICL